MTELNQTNGSGPASGHGPVIPAQRAPGDTVPPGVWRGQDRDETAPQPEARERVRFIARVSRVVTHPRTRAAARTTAKGAVRQGAYVLAGGRLVARRTWDARTTARHERMMRAAEAANDHATAKEWEQRAEAHRAARHQRRMALLSAPVVVARAMGYGAASLLALGILLALTSHHLADVIRPLVDAGEAVRWTMATAAALWHPLSTYGPWAALAALWAVGKARADMPAWLATSGDADELVIDERTITLALKALGIKQISAHLKDGLPLQYITPARVDGRGTFAAIRLPAGVPAELVAKKRGALATGLQRAAKEVWPTVGTEAGILNLWVADKGALAEGAGPYPLLTEGSADFFKGLPFGKTLRGTPVIAPVAERNTIVGGMPGQGKSSAARNLVAGAALDPTCELRIWVPDANFDFEAFKPRCSRYVMGAEDENIAVILRDLEALHEEIQERGRLLVKYEEPAVTRKLADREPKLRPLICLLEEAHVAFNHPVHGKEISRLVVEIVRLGRKRAVHFIVSTQAPTAKSIPRDVTRNCSNGLAFAVADHVANDALLGDGAHRGGHRATELLPGVDKGTCLAKGLTGERSDIVQVHFIDVSRGNDQITPLIKRALAAVEKRSATVLSAPETEAEKVDQLADIAQVLHGERVVKTEEVVHRLKVLRPSYYKDWTTAELKAALRPFGADPYKTNGTMHVGLERVREAIAERDNESASDETGGFES
jgi:S-DNA-T family DNA segregation ATPase FtsK/SpoIIIE